MTHSIAIPLFAFVREDLDNQDLALYVRLVYLCQGGVRRDFAISALLRYTRFEDADQLQTSLFFLREGGLIDATRMANSNWRISIIKQEDSI